MVFIWQFLYLFLVLPYKAQWTSLLWSTQWVTDLTIVQNLHAQILWRTQILHMHLSLSLSLSLCRHNGLYRAHSIIWKGSSFKLVLGKFFPSNEEPPVLVLNNKLELFFSSILFPHLNGIKEPVLGPVHKKKIPITTRSRPSSKPDTIGSFTAPKDVHNKVHTWVLVWNLPFAS